MYCLLSIRHESAIASALPVIIERNGLRLTMRRMRDAVPVVVSAANRAVTITTSSVFLKGGLSYLLRLSSSTRSG